MSQKSPMQTMFRFITLVMLLTTNKTSAIVVVHESPVIELYMHDIILGGSCPTARPITGLLGNIYNGQVPFARPLGFNPPQDGVAIPNSNGVVPTFNVNGVPLGTGLSGTAFAIGNNNNNPNNNAGAQVLLPDGLGWPSIWDNNNNRRYHNTITGFRLPKCGHSTRSIQMMAFTAVLEGGEYMVIGINFFGVYKIGGNAVSLSYQLMVELVSLKMLVVLLRLGLLYIPNGQHDIDGAQSLFKILVHLKH